MPHLLQAKSICTTSGRMPDTRTTVPRMDTSRPASRHVNSLGFTLSLAAGQAVRGPYAQNVCALHGRRAAPIELLRSWRMQTAACATSGWRTAPLHGAVSASSSPARSALLRHEWKRTCSTAGVGSAAKPAWLQQVTKPQANTPFTVLRHKNLAGSRQLLHTSATAAPRQASPSAGCISSAGAKSALRQCCLKAS